MVKLSPKTNQLQHASPSLSFMSLQCDDETSANLMNFYQPSIKVREARKATVKKKKEHEIHTVEKSSRLSRRFRKFSCRFRRNHMIG